MQMDDSQVDDRARVERPCEEGRIAQDERTQPDGADVDEFVNIHTESAAIWLL